MKSSRHQWGAPRVLRIASWLGLATLVSVLATLAAYRWSLGELVRVEQEIKAEQFAAARERLERLGRMGLGGVEAQYWRGASAEAEGNVNLALKTWAAIPRGAPRYANALLRRARLARDNGRFALAEELLESAEFARNSPAFMMREALLQHLYFFTGRSDDLRRRKHEEWAIAAKKAEVLRTHWQIDEPKAAPLRTIQAKLTEAGRMAPDDDRVWLGKAYLAIRMAQFDEADAWLQRCLTHRPEDVAVWRARLDWAMACDRIDKVVEALRHLPADRVEPAELLTVSAWLASRLGNQLAEEDALHRLLKRVPGDTRAVSRLTELALRAGRADEAALLRRRKAELDAAADAYRRFLYTEVPTGHFAELGRIAESLGRWFEARGWWALAQRDSAHADLARAALTRLDQIQRNLAALEDALQFPVAGPHSHTVADALTGLIPRDMGNRAGTSSVLRIPVFRDDAQAVGLHATYDYDPTPLWRMPEMMGGGVGLLDYDGDGWLDVYAVQGGTLSNEAPPPPVPQRDRLFRNRRDGTFEDVTVAAGLAAFPGGYGHGVAVGDYDNDGRPDLFVSRWRSYALYHNRGDGTFEDVTVAAGLSGNRDWPTSAAFADLDGDGDLDLYVCHYSAWDPQRSHPCVAGDDPRKYVSCGPLEFPAKPDHVFRNDGCRFVDVSAQAGIRAVDHDGRGLGVVAAHLDDDARIDLYVANDRTANFLFRNEGGFRFRNTAAESGVATSADGSYLAGMGIACGDLDGDGRMDLAVTNFYGESTTFYQNLGAGQFIDHTAAIGLAAPSRFLLGFGTAFLDANSDGWLDLATANGHVNDLRPDVPFAMPGQLFLGEPTGRLVDVSARAGSPWLVPRLGRGLAVGDLDNDGRLDILVVAEGGPLAYFHNQGPTDHFVTLQLEGAAPASNRDAVGARVVLNAGGRHQVAERTGGGSFLSASDHRIHFGLGESTRVDSIEVRWPSGRVDRYAGLAADAPYLLREGQPQAHRLHGWRR
jgi:tetratricopeptide (TPR) repeat protein